MTATSTQASRTIGKPRQEPLHGGGRSDPRPRSSPTPSLALREPSCACGGSCPRCGAGPHSLRVERQRRVVPSPFVLLNRTIRQQQGHPLPREIQNNWGARLRRDLSWLSVYSDGTGARAVSDCGTSALSYGRHLFFAPGRYAPHSHAGRLLIGHEVAHALRSKDGGSTPGPLKVAPREQATEAEADHVAASLAQTESRVVPLGPPSAYAVEPPGLRGDKRITFSGAALTVTDTYVLYGDGASAAFLQTFQRALATYYTGRTFSYRGYTVTFNLSVRFARYTTRTHRDREGFEYHSRVMSDSGLDSDTKLFEVDTGSGRAGGLATITLYETSNEATIAHEVGHYLSDRIGYFSERYSESLTSRLGITERITTPEPGCEGDIMATLAGTVTRCALADFLDEAIDAHEAPPALEAEDWSLIYSTFPW